MEGNQIQGMEGQGQPSGEYQYSGYELANKLRPPAEMTRLERLQEIETFKRPDHPHFTSEDQKIRLEAGARMRALMEANDTPEVKAATDAKRKQAFDEEMRKIQEKNAEEDERHAIANFESTLQMRWGADYKGNLGSLQKFIEENLTDTAKDLLDTPDPKTGVPLGNNPEFASELFGLLRKYGAAR